MRVLNGYYKSSHYDISMKSGTERAPIIAGLNDRSTLHIVCCKGYRGVPVTILSDATVAK
ncbi:hypothetical protein AG1IA_07642 [Rhizoctonia solani AG-1 IA]|uniref:Uncharacterized protein n=1 Tax=Thanatephorus cucumeris (strain AG1-IA) TaxID=983506 RepID=L8WKA4_THACA|nr:hypothetical protein AG1IA_07642 [Rhizoctonia solani AG-1 IA]